jgi:hypothetical protein
LVEFVAHIRDSLPTEDRKIASPWVSSKSFMAGSSSRFWASAFLGTTCPGLLLEGPPVCFEILISATPPFGNDLGGPSSTTQTPAIKFAENGHFDAIFSAPWIGYSASVQHGVPVGLRKPAKHPGCQAHALPSLRSRSGGQNLWLKKA